MPFAVRTLTANNKPVVDASKSRTQMVLVTLAVRAPARSGIRRTLAGIGKAESTEFHGNGKGTLQSFALRLLKERKLQREVSGWVWVGGRRS